MRKLSQSGRRKEISTETESNPSKVNPVMVSEGDVGINFVEMLGTELVK
jgi:hypothetical protein